MIPHGNCNLTRVDNATVDTLYEEGLKGSPKMMTTALHCRIMGKPGRTWALKKFLDYVQSKEGVWIATVRTPAYTRIYCAGCGLPLSAYSSSTALWHRLD